MALSARLIWLLCCLLIIAPATATQKLPKAAIATAHPLATKAGFAILEKGGNAFDAAIAISAVLAVVEPAGSGLGGGGFWLLHRASDGTDTMIDGRETAPGAAYADMYLDSNGKVNNTLSLDGPLASGIPGVPAALDHLSKHYGVLNLAQTLAPAIHYATNGFAVSARYQKLASLRLQALKKSPESNRILLRDGAVPKIGTIIRQHDLAHTLKKIAHHGRDGFYQGDVAEKLVRSVVANGGIWTLADLKNYQVKERQPITGSYDGYRITSAALPSSGGIVLMLMLNQLAELPLKTLSLAQKRHALIEVMRRAYFDRKLLGDDDFIAVPREKLLSKPYAKKLIGSIDLTRASPINRNNIASFDSSKGEDTTHFSVIDQYGNRVSATLSIHYPFGSGFIAQGTGVILNDEMDDFSTGDGIANVYGLIGSKANTIEPYKRPLSSMTPTFIESDDKLMIIGTPGGSRIITMVLLGMLDFIAGKKVATIVSEPRFHHQYAPNQVQVEPTGFSDRQLTDFKERGHRVKQLDRHYGNMQVIIYNKRNQRLTAASDPRGEGLSLVQHVDGAD